MTNNENNYRLRYFDEITYKSPNYFIDLFFFILCAWVVVSVSLFAILSLETLLRISCCLCFKN